MNDKQIIYINENRFKQSMMEMARNLSIPYSRIRIYMVENDLMLTKKQINDIKQKTNNSNRLAKTGWSWPGVV
tara:strand:+ start:7945 stop:8163 length:219 start_codon:yes stop_codon:yes gene_type:complete